MSHTGKERAALRAEAHHLDALIHVGQAGVTPALLAALEEALQSKELVKVQLVRNAEVTAKEAATQLAAEARAEVVQVIGRTVTLYRHNPTLVRRPGDAPPWRR